MSDRTPPGRGPRPARPSTPPRPPARVFWIRRLVVLGLPLLVVVALVVWWTGRGGDEQAGGEGRVAVVPEQTTTPTPAGVPDCSAEQLEVVVATAAESFPEGAEPGFEITVTNTQTEPCLVEAGDAQREVVVTSGDDRVWSSLDCTPSDAPARTLLLAGGQSDETRLTWPRQRSAVGCADGLPTPGEGTYSVTVTLGGATSPAAVFGLG